MRAPSRDSGFTLVEVLIALFIFALISAGTMTALSTSINGKDQIEMRLDNLAQIQTARALIREDMSNIILRDNRDSYGNAEAYSLSGGVDHILSFTRGGRVNPGGLEPRGDVQRVIYLFEDGTLIRRALTQDNPAPNTPYYDRVLLSGLSDVEITFLYGQQRNFQLLVPSGQEEVELDAVRLMLNFDNDDTLEQLFEVRL